MQLEVGLIKNENNGSVLAICFHANTIGSIWTWWAVSLLTGLRRTTRNVALRVMFLKRLYRILEAAHIRYCLSEQPNYWRLALCTTYTNTHLWQWNTSSYFIHLSSQNSSLISVFLLLDAKKVHWWIMWLPLWGQNETAKLFQRDFLRDWFRIYFWH